MQCRRNCAHERTNAGALSSSFSSQIWVFNKGALLQGLILAAHAKNAVMLTTLLGALFTETKFEARMQMHSDAQIETDLPPASSLRFTLASITFPKMGIACLRPWTTTERKQVSFIHTRWQFFHRLKTNQPTNVRLQWCAVYSSGNRRLHEGQPEYAVVRLRHVLRW